MRALVHVGLAALLVISPAFCCCNLHYLTGRASAAPRSVAECPVHLQIQAPAPTPATASESCCEQLPRKKACCDETPAPAKPSENKPAPKPQPRECPACERPAATTPELSPVIAPPEFTGELLPVAFLVSVAIPFEHLGLLGGLDPPERAGVDARSEALFSRHVMHC